MSQKQFVNYQSPDQARLPSASVLVLLALSAAAAPGGVLVPLVCWTQRLEWGAVPALVLLFGSAVLMCMAHHHWRRARDAATMVAAKWTMLLSAAAMLLTVGTSVVMVFGVIAAD